MTVHRGRCHCGAIAFEAERVLERVAPYYVARSNPDEIDVSARCLEGFDLASVEVDHFDGQNWEEAQAQALSALRG